MSDRTGEVAQFLRKYVLDYASLDDRDLCRAASLFTIRRVERGNRLLVPGEICGFETLVVSGCLRVYFNELDGSERVLYFAPEGWWVTDVESLVLEQPTTLEIDAIEPTELLLIRKSSRALLQAQIPAFDRFLRLLTENTLVALQRRLVTSMRKTAAQRYLEFGRLYPGLDLRIPQYHVAAYLGISAEFLCKLRKRVILEAS